MKEMTTEVKSYKCNWCGELHKNEHSADECAFNHAKENYANSLLQQGCNLRSIQYRCGFKWELTDEQKEITKDNCFVMSHWQCSKKPAYKITHITSCGYLKLWGKGGWSGYYGHDVKLEALGEVYPKEDLFVYGEGEEE